MKQLNYILIVGLLIGILLVPASAFATSSSSYSNSNFISSIFNQVILLINGTKEDLSHSNYVNYDYVKEDKNKDWYKWYDKGRDDDSYKEHKNGCIWKNGKCIESKDIWKDWYCKDWDWKWKWGNKNWDDDNWKSYKDGKNLYVYDKKDNTWWKFW